MTRDEIVELVRRIMSRDTPQEEADQLVDLVSRHIPDPEWMKFAFWDDRDLSPEQVVDEAFKYRAIRL